MYRTALRNVLAHKGRLFMTMLAVLLGTASVAGTLIFSDSVGQSLTNSVSSSFSGISVQATDSAVGLESGPKDKVRAAAPLTEAMLRQVAALPGAASARGTVLGFAGLADAHGNLIGKSGSTHGTNWVPGTDGQDAKYPMVQGTGPTGPKDLAVDRQTASGNGIKVGDTVRLAVNGPVEQMTVTGIFSTDDPQVKSGGSLVLFDTATAQQLYLKPGQFGSISAAAKPGVSEAQLLGQVEQVVPHSPNIKTETVAQLRADQASLISAATEGLDVVLLSFAGIALFVGVFLISNTFSMLIAQRTRELALLRAVGATRRQVNRSVLLEALLVGFSASVVGLLVGIGIGAGMQSLMGSIGGQSVKGALVVSPTSIVATLLTGTAVTALSALLPALRASRIPPVAAMSSNDTPPTQRRLIVRNSIGLVLAVAGVGSVVLGVGQTGDSASRTVGLGALLTLVGVFVLTPLLSRPVIGLFGPLYRQLFGLTGNLARQNALRNPRRTAATASALTVGVTLISLLAVIGASMNSAIDKQVTDGLKADYRINALVSQPISPALLPAIARVPGVAVVAGLDSQVLQGPAGIDVLSTYGVDPSTLDQVMVPKMVSGSTAALAQGQLLIEQATAVQQHLTVGSSIKVAYPDGTDARLTIGGIYQTSAVEGPSLISEAVLSPHTTGPSYNSVLVKGSNGASAQLQQALKDATGDNPLIQVQDHQQLKDSFSSLVTLLLEITYGLLGMAVLIAVLGVVNTLAMSVFERKREIGMLRAIGLDRGGIKRMIRLESVVIAACGAMLGVVLGSFLAWAVVRVSATSVSDLSTELPAGQLLAFLVGAVLVGLLAALWPARRAAGLNILESIKSD